MSEEGIRFWFFVLLKAKGISVSDDRGAARRHYVYAGRVVAVRDSADAPAAAVERLRLELQSRFPDQRSDWEIEVRDMFEVDDFADEDTALVFQPEPT